jgi:hypothetical protein
MNQSWFPWKSLQRSIPDYRIPLQRLYAGSSANTTYQLENHVVISSTLGRQQFWTASNNIILKEHTNSTNAAKNLAIK